MIEPVSDALTTSIRPACRAKNAMISSAMLPNVALRMPPTCGPVSDPRRSVDRPTTQASPRIAAAETTNSTVWSAWSAEVEDDRGDAQRRRVPTSDDPAEQRQRTEDRDAAACRRLGSGHRRNPSGRRVGVRRAAGAGCPVAAATCRAASPRAVARGDQRARPRPARPSRAPVVVRRDRDGGAARSTPRRRARTRREAGSRRRGRRGQARRAGRGRSSRGAWSARGRRRRVAPRRTPRRGRAASPPRARAPRRGPSPRSSAAIRPSRSRRSRPLRGRNPSNAQRGPATPDAATAASTADAPGIGTTVRPRPPRPPPARRPGR